METPHGPRRAPSRFLTKAWTLGVDVTTAEVLRAFEGAGLRSILLKGPTLQRELYDARARPYHDTDLLVSPEDLDRAAPSLSSLGFALALDHRRHVIVEPHAQEWTRARPLRVVDLHWRVPGVRLDARAAWEILSARSQPFTVAGAEGRALGRAGLALLVALHAANTAPPAVRPTLDLCLALDRFAPDTWAAAVRLAEALEATDALAAGLRSRPAGEAIAAAHGLPAVRARRLRLAARGPAPGAHGLLRIAEAQTTRARVHALREALLPSPELVRATMPVARRGRSALALAYMLRAGNRAARLPAALRDVHRSRT
jgi:Uncharacterised nucleotidyltransferase